jgi:N-acyl-D-aspartate/D-glutamate deacylase
MRRRLVEEAHAGDYGRAIGAELRTPDFDLMQVLIDPGAPNPSVAEMASSRGVDPVELMIDLALETDFDQCFAQFHIKESQDALLRAMTQPTSVMTFSDSGAHVSQIADSSIQSYLLSYWVRQRQDLTLERAVRMLSHDIASAWRIPDRGVLREGAFADLNVIDPAAVTPMLPTVVADVPAGGRRLVQRSRGFQATVVNGVPLLVDGEHTGALPGRLLRGASAAG